MPSAPRAGGWEVPVPALVLAICGGVLAIIIGAPAAPLLDEGARAALPASARDAEAASLAGIAAAATLLGVLMGAPLGVAVRSMRPSPASLALRLLMLLPLALPPLALAGALDSLIGARAWLDEALRAALLLVIAQAPLAAGVVAVSVSAGAPPHRKVLETARLLGAGRVRRFLSFELRSIAPRLALGLALAFLLAATSLSAAGEWRARVVARAPADASAAASEARP